jgi:hypothetical protein
MLAQDEGEDTDDDEDDDSSITVVHNQTAIARGAMIQKSFGTPSMAGPSGNHAKPYVFRLSSIR